MSTPSKKILMLSASYGAGHTRAAEALVAHLTSAGGTALHRDLLSFISTSQAARMRFPYLFLVRHAKWLYRIIYHAIEYPIMLRIFRATYFGFLWKHGQKVLAYIQEESPDFIICTHFAATELLEYAAARGVKFPPFYVCVTDYGYHPMWSAKRAAGYLVGATETALACEQSGISASDITISGIPVDPVFSGHTDTISKEQITVVLGGYGLVAPITKIEETIKEYPTTDIHIICGKNKRLERKLKKRFAYIQTVTVHGWVDNISDFILRSIFVITKTGGISTTECLVAGAAIDATSPIPGQETENYEFLKKRNLLKQSTGTSDKAGIPVFEVASLPFI